MEALLAFSPRHFAEFVGDFLRARGFTDVERVGRAGDLGIDSRCQDHDGRQLLVQCKRYRPDHKIGSTAIQTFIGMAAHHRAELSIIVTTSDFAVPARRLASERGIELIDGGSLFEFFGEFVQRREEVLALPREGATARHSDGSGAHVNAIAALSAATALSPAHRVDESIGGHLCLDFVNTVFNRHAPRREGTRPGERLPWQLRRPPLLGEASRGGLRPRVIGASIGCQSPA